MNQNYIVHVLQDETKTLPRMDGFIASLETYRAAKDINRFHVTQNPAEAYVFNGWQACRQFIAVDVKRFRWIHYITPFYADGSPLGSKKKSDDFSWVQVKPEYRHLLG